MREIKLLYVFIFGLVLSLVYMVIPDLGLSKTDGSILETGLWLIGFSLGPFFLYKGFDFRRIKFSSFLSFLSIISFLYIFFVIVLYIQGVPTALGMFLTPFLSLSVSGFLHERFKKRKIAMEVTRGVAGGFARKIRSTISQLDRTMWFFLIFGFAYLFTFLIIPILSVLIYAFIPPVGGEWWSNFETILRGHLRPESPTLTYVNLNPLDKDPIKIVEPLKLMILKGVDYGSLINSLLVSAIVTLVATVLGAIVAFALARYDFKGKMLLRILAMVPLFVTPFVNSYVIRLLWGEGGPISQLVKYFTGYTLRVEGLAGVIISQIMTFYPIVYLNAYASFLNVDPSTEEQAENLGAKGLKLFLNVTLPLALPGIVAGSIIVFIFSLEDLAAPIVFNYKNLISYQIYDGIINARGAIYPEKAALGLILLFISLTGFIAIRNYVGMRSYAMISRGGRWQKREHKLGVLGSIAVYLGIFPLVLFTAFPQIGVVLMSFNILQPYVKIEAGQVQGLVLQMPSSINDLTIYMSKALTDPNILNYLKNTFIYASISVVLAVFIAISVGYSVSRLKIKWLSNLLDSLATAPLAIPGLVVALGYYIVFSFIGELNPGILGFLHPANPGFQAWIVFIIAFSVRRLPYVVRSVFAGFQQVHENLEEAAMNLGASRIKVVFGVIFPFIIGYVLSGALLGFIYMSTEVSTSITFGGINENQAPLTYYMRQYYSGGAGIGVQVTAAMGTILILLQLVAVLIVVYVFKQRYAFIGA
ncbi:iron ABC transporter permease [Thermosphaera chiliense]|uniref:Iron ABC transporter permease n=2 Tax=Thermosphaera chiliense TaxID=3402707 RepID=A0A7M1USI2_9CREN|nr:iron ABC transporter permease [Thermosphaera aggregans]